MARLSFYLYVAFISVLLTVFCRKRC